MLPRFMFIVYVLWDSAILTAFFPYSIQIWLADITVYQSHLDMFVICNSDVLDNRYQNLLIFTCWFL